MRKIYLFLAFCLMSVMPVRAEKDYVAIISPYPDETVLTLYYVDNPQEFCKGVNERLIVNRSKKRSPSHIEGLPFFL